MSTVKTKYYLSSQTLVDLAIESLEPMTARNVCLMCDTKTAKDTCTRCERRGFTTHQVVPIGTPVFTFDVHYLDPAHRASDHKYRVTAEIAKDTIDTLTRTAGWEFCAGTDLAAAGCIQLERRDGLITIHAGRA